MKPIWKLLLMIFFSIILIVGVYAIGFEYDKANKLYSELYFFGYDVSMEVYGKRWERLATLMTVSLLLFDIVTCFIWFRRKQNNKIFSTFQNNQN